MLALLVLITGVLATLGALIPRVDVLLSAYLKDLFQKK
jgi:hypothetical protein